MRWLMKYSVGINDDLKDIRISLTFPDMKNPCRNLEEDCHQCHAFNYVKTTFLCPFSRNTKKPRSTKLFQVPLSPIKYLQIHKKRAL